MLRSEVSTTILLLPIVLLTVGLLRFAHVQFAETEIT